MTTVDVSIAQLSLVTERLFEHLTAQGIQVIQLDVDYYWNINHDEVYNLNQTPTNINVGQLSDDWHELRRILSNEQEPLAYQLVWLSAILRAIGEKLVT